MTREEHTLAQVVLIKLPQLAHLRRLPRHRALNNLRPTTQDRPNGNGICYRHRLDTDDPNAWIIRAAVVNPIAEVTEPGLERRRIVRPHLFTVRDYGRFAADGGPLARAVEESNVDVRV